MKRHMRLAERAPRVLGLRSLAPVALMAALLGTIPAKTPVEAQVVASAGRTLFNEGLLVRTLIRVDVFEGSRRLRNAYAIVWGARPHLSLSLETPLVRTTQDGVSTAGTGDTSVFARYDVWRRNLPAGYTRLAPELGLKLPTGGAFGTGSTDLMASLVFSHVRDPDWWIADVQSTLSGSGDEGIHSGNRVRLDLAYLRRVVPRAGMGVPMVLVVVELNGESVGQTRRRGRAVPGTGGDQLFLSPGIEYFVSRRLVLEASVPIPVYQRLGSLQPGPEASVVLGLRWLV